MKPLDIKLWRDFARLWAQGAAVALVAAAGVMTLLLGIGTYRALSETQETYYSRYSFADVFASATRVPGGVVDRILSIEGVARADVRVEQEAVLDIPGLPEPATGRIISIPDTGEPQLNRLLVVEGRLPDVQRTGEVAVSKGFADANRFVPGDSFSAIMGGIRRTLTITGVALSPEFIYTTGSGDLIPDNSRYGIIWMRYADAASAFDLTGAFNSVAVQLSTDARQTAVIDALDRILKPYGGRGAYGRSEQTSHAYLEAELTQLQAMSYVLPPIFLGVAAFLVNMILARLVTLEREQIGLLKALGYRQRTIAWHYMKLALLIAAAGTLIGWGLGAWAGRGMAALYSEFYRFPFLIFEDRPDVFAISGGAALLAAALGSFQAVRATVRLSPAVAMAPPAPPTYRQFFLDRLGLTRRLPQGFTMAVRSLSRRPLRAGLTVLGISLSTALLVSGLFSEDALEFMIDIGFFKADRQHASLTFVTPLSRSGIEEVGRLPGVMAVEPFRIVPVTITNGVRQKRAALTGKPAKAELSRVLDADFQPVSLPESGVALSDMMSRLLDARVGDLIDVEILDGREETLRLPVTQIFQQFIGLGAYMEIGALNRALGEGPRANGAYLLIDTDQTGALYDRVKALPQIAGISLNRESLSHLRETIGENLGISRVIYAALAVVIVFGVVYNSMRIQLSERGRELASLRVLGFTHAEVSAILLTELAILTLAAIPLGWFIGFALASGIVEGLQSELFRFPLIIERSTYAVAGLVVLAATAGSAYLVQRRVAALDMVAVLKTRE